MSLAGTSTVLRSYAWDEVTQFSASPSEDPTDMDMFAFWTKSDEIKVEVDECKALCDMFESHRIGGLNVRRTSIHSDVMAQIRAGGVTLKKVGNPRPSAHQQAPSSSPVSTRRRS